MARLSRRAVAFVALIAVAGGLGACGGSEEEQRKAFIQFLQTRIVDKPGVAIPRPTAQEKIAFGRYAADYDVILNFANNADPVAAYRKFNYSLPRMDTAQNMLAQRAENRLAGRRVRANSEKLLRPGRRSGGRARRPEAARRSQVRLQRSVRQGDHDPGGRPEKIAPIAQKLAKVAADLGDYLYIHPDKVLANGNNFQIADTATHDSLVALTDELNANRKLFLPNRPACNLYFSRAIRWETPDARRGVA